jgi:hypothetical protein
MRESVKKTLKTLIFDQGKSAREQLLLACSSELSATVRWFNNLTPLLYKPIPHRLSALPCATCSSGCDRQSLSVLLATVVAVKPLIVMASDGFLAVTLLIPLLWMGITKKTGSNGRKAIAFL